MKAGELDRRITLQTFSTSRDANTNEQLESWADLDTVWAKVRMTGGREFREGSAEVGERKATFTIRYRSDVSQLARVSYAGEFWDIRDYRELGRLEGLELNCTAVDTGGAE